jgi:hypothetical protein
MAPRVSLSAFLTSAKSALAASTSKKQKLTFVVGNESAGKMNSDPVIIVRQEPRLALNYALTTDIQTSTLSARHCSWPIYALTRLPTLCTFRCATWSGMT